MADELRLCRIDTSLGNVVRIAFSPMPNEVRLAAILAAELAILDPNLLLIGRQVAMEECVSNTLSATSRAISLQPSRMFRDSAPGGRRPTLTVRPLRLTRLQP